jgi:hypothetical protein
MSPAESTHPSKSTGPRTPEGRAKSSHNATRHGLTGRVVVLPSEDMNVYNAFCKELMADLAPETPLERQYAQTFCDTQWRLNRARSYEDGMLALGHFEHAGSLDVDDPQILAALTAAKAFRENSKAFVNLSLYEQRLQRTQKKALRQLQDLQTKRIAARQADLDEALATHNSHKTKAQPFEVVSDPRPNQFVFSTVEIATEALRQNLRAEAQNSGAHAESGLLHTA